MLTDDQKAAILAEERYRQEIRQHIALEEPDSNRKGRLWAALNSAFFLWCMSSIVLTAVTFSYQHLAAKREYETARNAEIGSLDAEISTRLSFFARQLVSGVSEKEALLALNSPAAIQMANSAFAEYAPRTLRMLLWDLHSLVPSDQQPQLKIALDSLKDLASVLFLDDNERLLTTAITLTVNVRASLPLDDFFGDLDKASTEPEKRTQQEKRVDNDAARATGERANDLVRGDEVTVENSDAVTSAAAQTKPSPREQPRPGPSHIALDVNVDAGDPDHRRSMVFNGFTINLKNETIAALNTDRWGLPFGFHEQQVFLELNTLRVPELRL